jgi:hypothetical protein
MLTTAGMTLRSIGATVEQSANFSGSSWRNGRERR